MSPSRKITATKDTMSAWFCTMNSWLSTGGFLLLFLRIAMAGRELGAAAASPLPAQLLSPRPGRGGGGPRSRGMAAGNGSRRRAVSPRSTPPLRQQRPCRLAAGLSPSRRPDPGAVRGSARQFKPTNGGRLAPLRPREAAQEARAVVLRVLL